MKKILPYFIAFIFLASCSRENKTRHIRLRWFPNSQNEKITDFYAGFNWSLSLLGATHLNDSCTSYLIKTDNTAFDFYPDSCGFTTKAIEAILRINDTLKQSEEYELKEFVDAGRWLVLTLHNPPHYYQITECSNKSEFTDKSKYPSDSFVVNNSAVAKSKRMLFYPHANIHPNTSWLALEDYVAGKNSVQEIIDLMPNGQLRYRIYNANGELMNSSPAELGEAGSPSKCMWCHEYFLQPLRAINQMSPGFIPNDSFNLQMEIQQEKINAYRKSLNNGIQFEHYKDHEKAEWLYISFMEPSAYRIKLEWNITENELNQKLNNYSVHKNKEFPEAGLLYDRSAIDQLSPYHSSAIPQLIREHSPFYPDYFNVR